MINVIARGGQFGAFVKSTAHAVPAPTASILVKAVIPPKSDPVVDLPVDLKTSESLSKSVSAINSLRVISGPAVSTQVRFAHTDINVSDFQHYRRESTKDPHSSNKDSQPVRSTFSYVFGVGTLGGLMYGGKGVLHSFVTSMSASKDVLAVSTIEIDLNAIPEGSSITFKWRGKPLFVRHRTAKEVAKERSVPLGELRDPQADEDRTQKPEWLIVLGVCTHLGCVPIANAGDFGGYYCPCHGSHYDASGRIRKGPAPLNLEVPKHAYIDEKTLLVG